MMRKKVSLGFLSIVALTASLLIPLSQSPATANSTGKAWNEDSRAYSEGWPWPSLPNWWNRSDSWYKQQSFTDVRLGQWLPCKPEWSMNDCIQGVTVYDKESKKLGDLTFIQEPTFDPFEVTQKWTGQETPDTKEFIEGYAVFDASGFGSGMWKLPDGLKLSDGKDLVGVSVARMLGAVQVNISPDGLPNGVSLPVGYFFETTLKSKGLKKYTRWVTSNGKDPSITIGADDTVIFKGVASRFPVPNSKQGCNALYGGNEEKAGADAAFIAVNAATIITSENTTDGAAEVVMGTNGWWCFNGMTWDPKERQLLVNVAAPHFYPDGTLVDGWLELKIKGRLARQWWGISPQEATGYAKVEVTYTDGTSKTATVSANYIAEKDWIDLRAYGFTYSSPAIKVSMKKPESAQPTASPTPTASPSASAASSTTNQSTAVQKPTSSASAKKTITCVKGKTIKKVTTKTCPSGFRKR
ncbi:MAG: hypothetical protein ACO3CW_04495 [Candidatus Nanopelagicaceae bacterium]